VKRIGLKPLLARLFIFYLLIISLGNQFRLNIRPLWKARPYILEMFAKDDLGQLSALSIPLYKLVEQLRRYPEETIFYFAPIFEDWKSKGINWWYIYILCRYFAYPRKVLAMDRVVYHSDKEEYTAKFIRGRKYYAELEWLKNRRVNYVVAVRDNRVFILPLDSEINIP
jgi:hypothetical protein